MIYALGDRFRVERGQKAHLATEYASVVQPLYSRSDAFVEFVDFQGRRKLIKFWAKVKIFLFVNVFKAFHFIPPIILRLTFIWLHIWYIILLNFCFIFKNKYMTSLGFSL